MLINKEEQNNPQKRGKRGNNKISTKIDDLYDEKKYQEVIDFYEGNPELQAVATVQNQKNYVLSLWQSGSQDKAVKTAWQYREKIGRKTYDRLKAISCEKEGKLDEAISFYRNAGMNDEANRLQASLDANKGNIIGEIDKHYRNKEYRKVVELFESNYNLYNLNEKDETVKQYVDSIHETEGVCNKLNKVIGQHSTLCNTLWYQWQAEYHESKGNFFEAGSYYIKAGRREDAKRMYEKEAEHARVKEEQRIAKETEQARALEAKGDYEAAYNKYKALNHFADCERLEDKVKEQQIAKQKQKEEYAKKMQEYLKDAVEGCDEGDLERAIEYAQKAGLYDNETKSKFENVKNAIRCMNNDEYSDAKRYFNKAGITHWNSQLDILANSDYSSYSSYGGGGCSECSNACKGGCGRSCSNGCSGSCTTSCGTACAVGRNKRKN